MIRLTIAGLVALLFFAPILGLLEQPWSVFWLGQQSVVTIPIGTPVTIVLPTPTVPVPMLKDIIAIAEEWLGVPYLWGGCTKHGVDCSCLMQNVFREVGIRLPRTTVDQVAWATPITKDQARAGDLVFFDNTCVRCGANPTHVGLVTGTGMMIDAGNTVKLEPIFAQPYFNARYGRVHL